MRHATTLGLAVALSSLLTTSVALSGQRGGNNQAAASMSLLVERAPAGCPISLRADHGSGLRLLKTGNKSDGRDMEQTVPNQVGQTIRLILADPTHGQITGAKVTARGLTARGRVFRTSSPSGEVSDVTRTMDVSFSAEDAGSASANLWLPGFSSVNSLELLSVTYADGASRKFDDENGCSIAPDPLMLISAH